MNIRLRGKIVFGALFIWGGALALLRCANDTLFDAGPNHWNAPFAFVSQSALSVATLADTATLKLADTITVFKNAEVSCIGLISNPRQGLQLKGTWDFRDGHAASAAFDSSYIVKHSFADTGLYWAKFSISDAIGDEAADSVVIKVIARPISIGLLSPSNDSTNVDPADPSGVFFLWQIVNPEPGDTVKATLFLGKDTASLPALDTGLVSSGIGVTNLEYATTYYWRVAVKRGASVAAISATFSFSTKSKPPPQGGPVVLSIRQDTTVFTGDTVAFFASVKDSGSSITEYAWDFNGDSIFESKSGTTASCKYAYADTGHYKAVFKATDSNDKSASETVRITVISRIPAIGPKIMSIRGDTSVTIRDSMTYFAKVVDSSARIIEYAWDFDGNGTWDHIDSTTDSCRHAYLNTGKYNAILRVTDKNGKTAFAAVEITVTPDISGDIGPVILSIRHDTTVTVFDTVSFFATVTDTFCSVTKIEWDFDNDGVFDCSKTSSTDTCKKSFTSIGTYNAVFRATDSLGKTTSDSIGITVKKIHIGMNFISRDTIVDYQNTVRCSVVVSNQSIDPVFEIDTMRTGVYRPMNSTGATGVYSFRVDTAAFSDSVRIRVHSPSSDTLNTGFKVSVRPRALSIIKIDSTDSTITVYWSKTLESNFKEYLVYSFTNNNVDTGSTLWATDTQASTVSSTSAPHFSLTPRYYQIYQRDKNGLLSQGSNVVFGDIKNSAPSKPIFTNPSKNGDTMWANGVVRWSHSVDKNKDPVTYDLLFKRSDGADFIPFVTGITDTFYRLKGIDSLSLLGTLCIVARDTRSAGDSSELTNIVFRQVRYSSMYLVPKGSFTDSAGNSASISYDYFMDSIEVNQVSWKMLMGGDSPASSKGDQLPLETVTWYQAVMYCNALSKNLGYDTAYTFSSISATGGTNVQCNFNVKAVRLPTEDEWEMAAQGGSKLLYATDDGSLTCPKANYGNCGVDKTVQVGSYPPNPYALYEMTGNVDEWCWDVFNSPRLPMPGQTSVTGRVDYAYSTSFGFGTPTRAIRGGHYQVTNLGQLQAGSRRGSGPGTSSYRVGFRCVIPNK